MKVKVSATSFVLYKACIKNQKLQTELKAAKKKFDG